MADATKSALAAATDARAEGGVGVSDGAVVGVAAAAPAESADAVRIALPVLVVLVVIV